MKARIRFLLYAFILPAFLTFTEIISFGSNPEPISDVFNGGRGTKFNDNWKFSRGDVNSANVPGFDDSSWQQLSVPHDWSIELSFDPNSSGGSGGGYLDGGIGWYRKTFYLPDSLSGKHITIQFEGIYMNSTVYMNNHVLGTRPYGYSTFEYDLTPYLNYGTTANVIAVRVNNNQPDSRWYSGSGIYRNVWLTVTDPLHIAYCGSFAVVVSVSSANADIKVTTKVQNHSDASQTLSVTATIYDNSGNGVASVTSAPFSIIAGNEASVSNYLKMENPILWSISNPYLYTVKTQIVVDRKAIDTFVSTLGVRTISFNPESGFWLNNENIKLHGVCMHHDLGSLGSAQNYRALERQVEILKSFGCNAIRTSHNPPAPELLEICDRLGLVVMDEAFDCWETGKTANDYGLYFDQWAQQDVQDWIRRDRNHPSVVMWSIGNEIPQQGDATGYAIAQNLIKWVRDDDTTRPVTQALNYQALIGPLLGIVGYNYASGSTYDNDHANNPGWVIMGSETSSAVRTRGIYHLPTNQNILTSPDWQCSSYDNSVVSWGNSAEDSWDFDRTRPFVVGQFIWTGFDYIGEPTPYWWPAKSSYFGIVDMCGFPKDIYYFYESQWTRVPMVHLLPHWNWSEGDTIPVWAYSNSDSVSLYINGVSAGTKTIKSGKPYHEVWMIPFTAGKIEAVAYKNGSMAATDSIVTSGAASQIKIETDRDTILADGNDLAFLETDMLDSTESPAPFADNQIIYSVTGPGKIAGVDNGNPISLESFKGSSRKAFNGKCLAIIQSSGAEGQIAVTASAAAVPDNIAINKPSHADSEDIYALKDIAVGKTSSSDGEQSWNPVSSGNDGNYNTRWCAADDNTGHWWKVDLGENHNIIGTEVIWEHTYAYQYKVETSTDNSTWKVAVDRTGNQVSAQDMSDSFSAEARYVRITITGGLNSGNWASFYEFEVFDGSLILGTQRNNASKANDGNPDTYWSAEDGNSGHSWVVDLGSSHNLTGSQVVWPDSGNIYKYRIETSPDSITWNIAADKTQNTSILQQQTDNFTATARYVRITITGGTSNSNKASIEEFRVFDGKMTNFNPATVIINCVKPSCKACIYDSTIIRPLVNVNNSGWQQSGSALLCSGGDVSFSTCSGDTTGWQWQGPCGFSASTMQINLVDVGRNNTGIYKLSKKGKFFNFQLNIVNDSINPYIIINGVSFKLIDSMTVVTGDTVVLSPMPVDSVGWKWIWHGPNGFFSKSRAVTIVVTDTIQKGTYIVTGSDGSGCGSGIIVYNLNIRNRPEITESEIIIYPNPSRDGIITILNCAFHTISVYNLTGCLMYSKYIISDKQAIDLSMFSRGLYIVQVSSDKIIGNKKIILNK